MLTSKQRAKLSSLANTLKPLVHVGRDGANAGVAEALTRALEDHELVKLRFVDMKDSRRELAEGLAASTGSDLVRVIGHVAIFFKPSSDPAKRTVKAD